MTAIQNKQKKASNNLRIQTKQRRYQEVVDLVRFDKSKLNILPKRILRGTIDPKNAADWSISTCRH